MTRSLLANITRLTSTPSEGKPWGSLNWAGVVLGRVVKGVRVRWGDRLFLSQDETWTIFTPSCWYIEWSSFLLISLLPFRIIEDPWRSYFLSFLSKWNVRILEIGLAKIYIKKNQIIIIVLLRNVLISKIFWLDKLTNQHLLELTEIEVNWLHLEMISQKYYTTSSRPGNYPPTSGSVQHVLDIRSSRNVTLNTLPSFPLPKRHLRVPLAPYELLKKRKFSQISSKKNAPLSEFTKSLKGLYICLDT